MSENPPLIPTGDGPAKYRVPPEQRSLNGQAKSLPRKIAGCKDDGGKGTFTSDGKVCLSVQESVYPGELSEPIQNKWVYVLLAGKLVAEADARTPEQWWVGYKGDRKAQPAARPLKICTKGVVLLDPGPPDNPHLYAFFLSPVRLTPKAFDYLFTHLDDVDSPVVKRSYKAPVTTSFALPDPFRWTCEVQLKWYQPLLGKYKAYVEDPERAAQLMIASVLKGWIGEKDPASVAKTLKKGEPQAFLDKYEVEEKKLRSAAEAAMAYVAHLVQSPEHRTVELAAEEAGGAALANLCCQYAAVTCRADETKPGREMLAALMAEQDRFPRKYLFADGPPPSKGFEFTEWRFAWLAALAAFDQLVPAWIAPPKATAVEVLTKYFENIDVKTLKGRAITLRRNILKGRDLRTGFGSSASAVQKYDRVVAGLLSEAEGFRAEIDEAKKLAGPNAKLAKMHKAYEPWLAHIKVAAGTVVEMANFVLALDALWNAKKDKGDKVWSFVGASADLTAHVLSIVESIMLKRVSAQAGKVVTRQMLKAAGPLGLISGACDMREFAGKSGEATGQNDYGAAVGHGIAAAGAAAVAVGGGMSLVFAVSGEVMFASAAGGPLGLVVGAIGAIVIIGGCLLVAWLTDNTFQSFAKLCRFGKAADDGKSVYFPWASGGMGSGTPVSEVKVLIDVLAQFRVKRVDRFENNTVIVEIEPGYLPTDSVFEVHFDRRAYTGKVAPEGKEVVAITCGEKDEALKDSGTPCSVKVSRDPKDRNTIKSIELTVPALDDSSGRPSFPVKDVYVRLNLTGDGSQTAPPFQRHVVVRFSATRYIHDTVSSSDSDHWVNSDGSEYVS